MATRDRLSFGEMCRTFPVRTGVFTAGPLAVGVAQFFDAVVHGLNLPLVTLVVVGTVVYSMIVTNYRLVTFRRRTVSRRVD